MTAPRQDASEIGHEVFVARLLASQRAIYAILVAILPNERDLDDLFQKVCLVLWQERARYDPGRPFLPWACGFARNIAREHIRATLGTRKSLCLAPETLDRIALARSDMDANAEARRAALDACVEKLSPTQLALLRERYEGPRSLEQIAAETKVSAAALTMRLQRIRHTLLKCVEGSLAVGEFS